MIDRREEQQHHRRRLAIIAIDRVHQILNCPSVLFMVLRFVYRQTDEKKDRCSLLTVASFFCPL
jgi:hypothetical protein